MLQYDPGPKHTGVLFAPGIVERGYCFAFAHSGQALILGLKVRLGLDVSGVEVLQRFALQSSHVYLR